MHRERHREPVVARRLDPPARRPGRRLHVQVVATGLGVDTHRAQVGGDQFEPVALLHAQLAHLSERRLPGGATRQRREDRHLVDQGRHLGGGHFRPPERRSGARDQIGDRLAPFIPQVDALHVRSHPFQHDETPGPGRVHTDVFHPQLTAFREHSRGDEKCGGGGVAGHRKPERGKADG